MTTKLYVTVVELAERELRRLAPAMQAIHGFTEGAERYLTLFGRRYNVPFGYVLSELVKLHPGRSGRDLTSTQFALSVRRVIQFWDAQPRHNPHDK